MPLRLYPASKIDHAQKWLDLSKDSRWTKHVQMIASWPQQIIDGYESGGIDPSVMSVAWAGNMREVMSSNVCLVYAEPGDVLRGALFEAGIAATSNRSNIMICGDFDHPSFGTWKYLPGTLHARNLDHALQLLAIMDSIESQPFRFD